MNSQEETLYDLLLQINSTLPAFADLDPGMKEYLTQQLVSMTSVVKNVTDSQKMFAEQRATAQMDMFNPPPVEDPGTPPDPFAGMGIFNTPEPVAVDPQGQTEPAPAP